MVAARVHRAGQGDVVAGFDPHCSETPQSTLPEYPGDLVDGGRPRPCRDRVSGALCCLAADRAALQYATNVEDGATTNIYMECLVQH